MKKILLFIGLILFIWLIWINYVAYRNEVKAPTVDTTIATPIATPSSVWHGPYGGKEDKG